MRLTDGVVVLRPPREDDVEPYGRACLDEEVLRWTRVPEDSTLESLGEYLFGEALDQEVLVIQEFKGGRADVAMCARIASGT